MKTAASILVILVFSSCVAHPKRPNYYPALDYPYVTLADLHAGHTLKYEGKDMGLDGGSHVYIFSTPKKKKFELWNLCQLAKQEYGYDIRLNAFMLKTGNEKENEHMVIPGSEIEKMLILEIKTDSKIPAEIVAGLKDRSHAIQF